jgi:hypothetical protein
MGWSKGRAAGCQASRAKPETVVHPLRPLYFSAHLHPPQLIACILLRYITRLRLSRIRLAETSRCGIVRKMSRPSRDLAPRLYHATSHYTRSSTSLLQTGSSLSSKKYISPSLINHHPTEYGLRDVVASSTTKALSE